MAGLARSSCHRGVTLSAPVGRIRHKVAASLLVLPPSQTDRGTDEGL